MVGLSLDDIERLNARRWGTKMVKRKKLKLTRTERARRSAQAKKNFGKRKRLKTSRSRRVSMGAKKKRKTTRSAKSSITGMIRHPLVKKAALGMGGGALGLMLASRFNIPGVTPQTAQLGGAFLLGGIEGAAIALLLPGFLGGTSTTSNGGNVI